MEETTLTPETEALQETPENEEIAPDGKQNDEDGGKSEYDENYYIELGKQTLELAKRKGYRTKNEFDPDKEGKEFVEVPKYLETQWEIDEWLRKQNTGLKKEVHEIYGLGDAGLFDEFFCFLTELGFMKVLEQIGRAHV